MNLEFEDPVLYTPDMSNVPERYLGASFEGMDFSGREPMRAFLAEYVRGFSHSGKDSLLMSHGETAAKAFVALYRAVASRVTADVVRFWDWPAQSAWLRSLGWRAEHELLDGAWGARFLFLFDVRADVDPAMLSAAVNDCVSAGRRLFVFARDDNLKNKLPVELAEVLASKTLPVRIKD